MVRENLQPLPLGTTSFSKLRRCGQIYVDKTDLICRMAQECGKYFLARPRRFGKSLLISTFESLFRDGLKDFRGLAAEKLWHDGTYAVARMDLSFAADFRDISEFRELFAFVCRRSFGPLGFVFRGDSGCGIIEQLSCWMESLPQASLVLLIDEYDAPLTSVLGTELFAEVRTELSRFFRVIKGTDDCLRFFFMTGITKFQNTSIFSAFNNLADISLDPDFGTLLGYTEKELTGGFGGWLDAAAPIAGYSCCRELVPAMRDMYDGFCFDCRASTHVYSPWSVLNFLNAPAKGLASYWYNSAGRPTMLIRYLASHYLDRPENYEAEKAVLLNRLDASQEMDSIDPNVLLTQAGYLTIKSVSPDGMTARLGYPNHEVSVAMAQLYAGEMMKGSSSSDIVIDRMKRAFFSGDLDRVANALNDFLLRLDSNEHPSKKESLLRTAVQVALMACGLRPRIETHNALGRSDVEAVSGRFHWVLELKVAGRETEIQSKLREGIEQARDRKYGLAQYEGELIRAAMVCSAEKRCFEAWRLVDDP